MLCGKVTLRKSPRGIHTDIGLLPLFLLLPGAHGGEGVPGCMGTCGGSFLVSLSQKERRPYPPVHHATDVSVKGQTRLKTSPSVLLRAWSVVNTSLNENSTLLNRPHEFTLTASMPFMHSLFDQKTLALSFILYKLSETMDIFVSVNVKCRQRLHVECLARILCTSQVLLPCYLTALRCVLGGGRTISNLFS